MQLGKHIVHLFVNIFPEKTNFWWSGYDIDVVTMLLKLRKKYWKRTSSQNMTLVTSRVISNIISESHPYIKETCNCSITKHI